MEHGEFLARIEKTTGIVHKKLNNILSNDAEPQLTPPYLKVLSVISKCGSCTMTDISNDLAVSLSAVTPLVDKLVELELATRIRSKKDRRIVDIMISERGTKVLAHKQELIKGFLDKCFSSFTQQEMDACIRVMEKVAQSLNEE